MSINNPICRRNPHPLWERPVWERPVWERPWPRRGCCRPPALIKAPIASKLAPTTVFAPGLHEPGEAAIAADRSSPRRRVLPSAVGVRRPLPQNPCSGSGGRSGAARVGAALAATGPLPSAGSDTGRHQGQRPPPTEPRLRLRRRIERTPVGAVFRPRQACDQTPASITHWVRRRKGAHTWPVRPSRGDSDTARDCPLPSHFSSHGR